MSSSSYIFHIWYVLVDILKFCQLRTEQNVAGRHASNQNSGVQQPRAATKEERPGQLLKQIIEINMNGRIVLLNRIRPDPK